MRRTARCLCRCFGRSITHDCEQWIHHKIIETVACPPRRCHYACTMCGFQPVTMSSDFGVRCCVLISWTRCCQFLHGGCWCKRGFVVASRAFKRERRKISAIGFTPDHAVLDPSGFVMRSSPAMHVTTHATSKNSCSPATDSAKNAPSSANHVSPTSPVPTNSYPMLSLPTARCISAVMYLLLMAAAAHPCPSPSFISHCPVFPNAVFPVPTESSCRSRLKEEGQGLRWRVLNKGDLTSLCRFMTLQMLQFRITD